MSKSGNMMTDAELDRALNLLDAPAPSDTLKHRVNLMAPQPAISRTGRRAAAVAALVIALGAAALVRPSSTPTTPVIVNADPAGEIPVPALQAAQGEQRAGITPTEPFSVAILPLE